MKLITRLRNRLPKYKKNVWYNIAVYTDENYPKVFDENGDYIKCKVGLKVLMGKTRDGLNIYYEVVKIWHERGSDYLYPSDSVNCDLKFSHICSV